MLEVSYPKYGLVPQLRRLEPSFHTFLPFLVGVTECSYYFSDT